MPKSDIHPTWYPEAKVICNGEVVMEESIDLCVNMAWLHLIQVTKKINHQKKKKKVDTF